MSIHPQRPMATGLANLVDSGELVSYPRQGRVSRRSGSYTWHAARISEEHALRAIGRKTMRVTAPDGHVIELHYERHVEHANGNWTWIGRNADGADAILTFGDKAVFGSIPDGDEAPLRLMTVRGRVWLLQTDRRKIAALDSPLTRPRRPDYRVPPRNIDGSPGVAETTAVAARAEALHAAATSTVDVLVGYTPGFAAMVGGSSQALTRIDYLVDVTNQAYRNSNMSGQVRLVHAMQVDYADNTSNSDTLGALTGLDGEGGVLPVPAALVTLRNARDQYGADLVSLVRRFSDPENDSCGVAWLIGGGQADVSSVYSPYGYSVVSDSQGELSPDDGYICRDETFAHELGHNMGAQHDVEAAKGDDGVLDANEYGRFAYSFGYKTGNGAGNFYTVMAYGDDGQMKWRVFSNPDITTCGGYRCGVANQADNARTLRQTMPVVATFRATVVASPRRAASDFDGDGASDLVWRNRASGANIIWRAANSSNRQPFDAVPNIAWTVVATDDFDGDGFADVLWRNLASGVNTIWRSANASTLRAVTPIADLNWRVAGGGDFDGDGRADILWRNASTGANTLWKSANSDTRVSLVAVADMNWIVAGIGDFDGNGTADILWRNRATGANAIWNGGNAGSRAPVANVPNLAWTVAGVGDFDRDGRSDILWRHSGTGENVIWLSGVATASRAVARVADQAWKVARIGDFDGDGASDIVWRNGSSGVTSLWKAGISTAEQPITDVADTTWQIVP